MVGVLVLVHQQVTHAGGHRARIRRIVQQVVHLPLQVGEVNTVGVQQGLFVASAGAADGTKERVVGSRQPGRIDQLFRDLVEVAACPFNGGPPSPPAGEEPVVVVRADNLVEVFEDEEKLCQLVQRFVVVSKFRSVPVSGEHPVAEPVDGGDRQFGEVASMVHLASRRGQSVAHLESGLLREGAKHDFASLGLTEQQEIQGPQDDAEGLAGPWPRDDQQRSVQMADDRALARGDLRVVLQNGRRDVHNSFAFLKLKVSSGDTIR